MSDIKYRHPLDPLLTWSGRGKAPKWFDGAISLGFTEDQMLVKPAAVDHEIDLGIGDASGEPAASGDVLVIPPGIPQRTVIDTQDQPGTVAAETAGAPVIGTLMESPEVGFAEINQLIGQIQMANSFARFADVVSLQKLSHIKETKAYKASKGVTVNLPNGEIADVGTWDGFCRALGMSTSKVDEDLINLRAFGEEALENLTRIGAGYRELRQFRKLPADQREALAQIATTGTKDDVLEAAYEAIEAESAKRSALEVQNAELSEDLKLAERRGKYLDPEIERQEMRIKKLSSARQRCTAFLDRTEDIRAECMALAAEAELPMAAIEKLFLELAREPGAPEWKMQAEQVWITAHVIAARAAYMIDEVRQAGEGFALPDRIKGTHILTPDEAQRWLLDYPAIANRHAAEAANRQEARESARPKGPGRPKGSGKAAAEE